LFTNASEFLREKEKRKKRQCRELVQRALVSIAMMMKKTMGKASEQSTAITKKYRKHATSIFLSKKDNPMQWSATHKK
jgi:hypothetical protein